MVLVAPLSQPILEERVDLLYGLRGLRLLVAELGQPREEDMMAFGSDERPNIEPQVQSRGKLLKIIVFWQFNNILPSGRLHISNYYLLGTQHSNARDCDKFFILNITKM